VVSFGLILGKGRGTLLVLVCVTAL